MNRSTLNTTIASNLSSLTIMIILLTSSYLICFLPQSTINWLTIEDGVVENYGAASLALGAMLFFALFLISKKNDGNFDKASQRNNFYNLWFLGLALLCFVMLGEEISWGQRTLGFATPMVVDKFNMQHEFNLHNLNVLHGKDANGERKTGWRKLLTGDTLILLVWTGYCVVIPLANHFSKKVRSITAEIQLPVVPGWISLLFVISYAESRLFELLATPLGKKLDSAVQEIKESNLEALFCVLAVSWLVAYSAYQRQAQVAH